MAKLDAIADWVLEKRFAFVLTFVGLFGFASEAWYPHLMAALAVVLALAGWASLRVVAEFIRWWRRDYPETTVERIAWWIGVLLACGLLFATRALIRHTPF